jgi:sulfide dehydrogenase cytochrome subunit
MHGVVTMHNFQRWFLAASLLSAAAAQSTPALAASTIEGLDSVLTAAKADPSNIEGLARTCNSCHGMNGVSAGQSMPSIAGLPVAYLKNVMLQWKKGERYSATMGRLIKGYTEEEIGALAAYFAKLPWTPVVQKGDAKLVAQGKAATDRCETCHGVTGGEPDDAETPKLNGQWSQYMELEIMKYRDETVAMPHKKMRTNAKKLEAGEVKAVSEFFGSQK